jgi:hypothetical protein
MPVTMKDLGSLINGTYKVEEIQIKDFSNEQIMKHAKPYCVAEAQHQIAENMNSKRKSKEEILAMMTAIEETQQSLFDAIQPNNPEAVSSAVKASVMKNALEGRIFRWKGQIVVAPDDAKDDSYVKVLRAQAAKIGEAAAVDRSARVVTRFVRDVAIKKRAELGGAGDLRAAAGGGPIVVDQRDDDDDAAALDLQPLAGAQQPMVQAVEAPSALQQAFTVTGGEASAGGGDVSEISEKRAELKAMLEGYVKAIKVKQWEKTTGLGQVAHYIIEIFNLIIKALSLPYTGYVAMKNYWTPDETKALKQVVAKLNTAIIDARGSVEGLEGITVAIPGGSEAPSAEAGGGGAASTQESGATLAEMIIFSTTQQWRDLGLEEVKLEPAVEEAMVIEVGNTNLGPPV